MTNETWSDVREDLRKAVGSNSYKAWIEPLRFKDLENRVARFYVPTSFMGNWVSRHYADKILQSLVENGLKADRIEFMLAGEAANKAASPAAASTAVPAAGQSASSSAASSSSRAPQSASKSSLSDRARATGSGSRFNLAGGSDAGAEDGGSGGPLDARYTFDSFVVGKPNQLAHTAAYRIASGGPVTFNPLFLYGGVGLGKTHLMHAIAWHLQTHRPDLKVLYLSAEQFMYRFIRALRENGTMEFKSLFRSVDVLMVDDVQFIAGKDSTQEEFFHTFNALIDQNKQIVISADRAPGEIKKLEDRIASRLQCGLVVDLHPTDYELRLGILQTKLDQHLQHYPDVRIADGVLEFLAHRITTNIRVLEGALTRLFAFASLVGKTVTLDLTQDCLSDILRNSERKVTVEEIQRAVSEHYNIRLSDLVGPRRHRTVARPRQVAMWLSKQLTPRSLPEIGRRFGGRDHTTVMHAVKRIEELKGADSQIAEDLDLLRRTLEM